jgi:hypothetical protein
VNPTRVRTGRIDDLSRGDLTMSARTRSGVVEKLERSLPVDDLVGWLLEEHPGIARGQLFSMLRAIYGADFEIGPAGIEQKTYRVGEEEFTAFPQRVQARPT